MPEHAELHLLLSMIVPGPWLERVPTYKEQQENISKDLPTYGFLGYPVLQAADILIYQADAVPVGEDQVPHIELAREIARRFNHLYGEVFPEPQALLTEATRCPAPTDARCRSPTGTHLPVGRRRRRCARRCARCSPTRRQASHATRAIRTSARCSTCTRRSRRQRLAAWAANGCRTAGIGCLDCKAKLAEHMLEKLAGDPGPAPRARGAAGHGLGRAARGLEAGARGGRDHDAGSTLGDEDPLRPHVSDETPKPVTVPEGVESVLPDDAPRITLPLFEGPLDLLLYLIRRDQIDIHDIPIAPITRQYMEYLELMQQLNLDVAGEFMVMAATLIHIKSKLLVPIEPTEAQGEEEAVDPREERVRRLLEFQRYKEAAGVLHQQAQIRAAQWTRPETVLPSTSTTPARRCSRPASTT